ncbi:MAG: type VI secretion system baseplate subunit TssF, partial [bacterium]
RFVAEMLRAGALGYLLKDSAFQDLLSAIRAVAANHVYLSPKVAKIMVKDFVHRPPSVDSAAFSLLTERQREVLQLLAEGNSTRQIASRLNLEPDKCEDPHVERLLEAFAFLAARVHLKIDDEFPEISEALLGILTPHYVRPIPSMPVAEFTLAPEQGKLRRAYEVEGLVPGNTWQ